MVCRGEQSIMSECSDVCCEVVCSLLTTACPTIRPPTHPLAPGDVGWWYISVNDGRCLPLRAMTCLAILLPRFKIECFGRSSSQF